MSIIGPNIRNAIIEPVVNCPTKVLAINASVSEHTANKNAKHINGHNFQEEKLLLPDYVER
jgi:hypothetical protein